MTRLSEEAVRADLGGVSVLLVEDNPVNRMVARGYLDRLGCQVMEAEDGARALALARAQRYDVVLLDIDLPDMRGDEVARQLRAELDPLPPRLVALTAHHLQDTVEERSRLGGVERVLTKPISPPRLLHEVLEGGAQTLPIPPLRPAQACPVISRTWVPKKPLRSWPSSSPRWTTACRSWRLSPKLEITTMPASWPIA